MENSDATVPALLQIHPADNIAVLRRSLPADAGFVVAGSVHRLPDALALGHKIALTAIPAGTKIIKYGVPIGSAVFDIAAGEHVHVHNMKSDYLPTYTLEEGKKYAAH